MELELKEGDIVVYETDDVKWFIIFKGWCIDDHTHMYYYAVYVCGDDKLFINDVCFLLEPEKLRRPSNEEHQLFIDELKKEGYEWDGLKLNKI